jgi:hypothetical protein
MPEGTQKMRHLLQARNTTRVPMIPTKTTGDIVSAWNTQHCAFGILQDVSEGWVRLDDLKRDLNLWKKDKVFSNIAGYKNYIISDEEFDRFFLFGNAEEMKPQSLERSNEDTSEVIPHSSAPITEGERADAKENTSLINETPLVSTPKWTEVIGNNIVCERCGDTITYGGHECQIGKKYPSCTAKRGLWCGKHGVIHKKVT